MTITRDMLHHRLRQATGLDLTMTTVEVAMRQRMKQLHAQDRTSYLMGALRDGDELCALVDLVVIPETWFFRDADAFQAARSFVLARIAGGRQPVQILSIPCATGEEPYSMAIALLDAGLTQENFHIEGIDISRRAIQHAQQAVFSRNAFRTTDLRFRDRFFMQRNDAYELLPEVKTAVHFKCGNLLAPELHVAQRRFDLIFCRNLLIYFDAPTQRAAIARLRSMLHDDGLLFSGYAETATFCQQGFAMAPFPKAFALRKAVTPETATTAHMPMGTRRARIRPVGSKLARHSVVSAVTSAPRAFAPMPTAERDDEPEADRLLQHARVLANQGQREEAEVAYRQCLLLVPDSAEIYFMLGLLNEQKRDVHAAAEHLRRALYLDPNHYQALCHLALLAERDGDAISAGQYRRRAARVFERKSIEKGER